jgi:hypothetical protein
VPLSWYQSTTHAFLDDETHSTIRRTYTSPNEQNAKRHFCGFCGTPLSYWTESPPSEADFISLTLGSLSGDDLRNLEELGLLPKEAMEDAENDKEKIDNAAPLASNILSVDGNEGLPWFEAMVEGSKLGKMRKSMGNRRSRDGSITVDWEIVEWTDEGEGEVLPSGKRKLGEVVGDEDSRMEGLH